MRGKHCGAWTLCPSCPAPCGRGDATRTRIPFPVLLATPRNSFSAFLPSLFLLLWWIPLQTLFFPMPTLLLREIRQNPFPINPKSRKLPPALFIIFSRQLIMTRYPFFRHPLCVFASPPVRALMRYLSLPYRYARHCTSPPCFRTSANGVAFSLPPHCPKTNRKEFSKEFSKVVCLFGQT